MTTDFLAVAVNVCGAVPTLLKKWKSVHRSVKDSEDGYAELCDAATDEEIQTWVDQEKVAQETRWVDNKAMDIYDVQDDNRRNILEHFK